MREILITVLVFGLIIFFTSGRSKKTQPQPAPNRDGLTSDRSTTESQPTGEHTTELQPVADDAVSSVGETLTVSVEDSFPAQPIGIATPVLEPEVTLPLATSLPLQEVIQPTTIKADIVPDLMPNPATIVAGLAESDTRKAQDREHQNVLEEIAQLEGGQERTIASITRQVNHPDPLIRATAAMTLGELAVERQGSSQEEIIALLNELLQDGNSEVRLQAAVALGKMQLT